jgi:hypothetical protein
MVLLRHEQRLELRLLPSLRVQGLGLALDAWLTFVSLLLTAAHASACQGAVTSDLTLLDMG